MWRALQGEGKKLGLEMLEQMWFGDQGDQRNPKLTYRAVSDFYRYY